MWYFLHSDGGVFCLCGAISVIVSEVKGGTSVHLFSVGGTEQGRKSSDCSLHDSRLHKAGSSPWPLRVSLLEAPGLCEHHCSPKLGQVQQGMCAPMMGRAVLSSCSHSRADLGDKCYLNCCISAAVGAAHLSLAC